MGRHPFIPHLYLYYPGAITFTDHFFDETVKFYVSGEAKFIRILFKVTEIPFMVRKLPAVFENKIRKRHHFHRNSKHHVVIGLHLLPIITTSIPYSADTFVGIKASDIMVFIKQLFNCR